MEEMFNQVRDAFGNYNYLILFLCCLAAGLVFLKGKRKIFLVPAAVISVVILNPLFIQQWDKVSTYGYWRTLWIIPVAAVCACVPAGIVERTEKNAVRGMAVAAALAVFVLCGSFIMNHPNTRFARATNADKLPQEVVRTAEVLLEADEEPRVLSDEAISTYLRQYSGKIQSPYSRGFFDGVPSGYSVEMYNALNEGNMERVREMMQEHGYKYVVTRNMEAEREQAISNAGFVLMEQVGGYGVYVLN